MTRRLSLVLLLMITVLILVRSSFTDDGSERSAMSKGSPKDQGVEGSTVDAPLSFSEALFRISSAYGIPPKLVVAIIQVESQGNPKAISPVGARGLMQLMPAVIKACEVEDPFDPLANILAGVRHLNYLLLEFSGNLSLALAAYNAGPGTVRRYGGIPPFPETCKFVNSVLRGFQGVGNELETFLQVLEVQLRSIQNLQERRQVTVWTESGEVFHGRIPGRYPAWQKILDRFRGGKMKVAYEAGPSGFRLHDQRKEDGTEGIVVPPSLIPMESGNWVKIDKRGSRKLAKLLEGNLLKEVYVLTEEERKHRELIRTRQQLVRHRGDVARQIKTKFLFHGICSPFFSKHGWTLKYVQWLNDRSLSPPCLRGP